jgi:hypothetical protein
VHMWGNFFDESLRGPLTREAHERNTVAAI